MWTTLKVLDHPPNDCTDLRELTSCSDKRCRDRVASSLIITGLPEQLNKKKRAKASLVSVAHLKSVVFKVVNSHPTGYKRTFLGEPT